MINQSKLINRRLKIICVIPARYGSTRFPGKPLAVICNKPMIQMVWEKAKKSGIFDRVIIATDDLRIYNAAKKFGSEVKMTSTGCRSGTDRVAEVSRKIKPDIVVNLQGDEPLIAPLTITKTVRGILGDSGAVVSTPVCFIPPHRCTDISNFNTVKVVFDKNHYALYFSRLPIPSVAQMNYRKAVPRMLYRGAVASGGKDTGYYKHIGLYAYRGNFLEKFVKMRESALEKREKLEQLRILENGYRIKVVEVKQDTIPVDMPSDVKKAERAAKQSFVSLQRALR